MKKSLLLVLAMVCMFISCKREGIGPVAPDTSGPTISTSAIVADGTTISQMTSSDNTSLTFSGNVPQLQKVRVGSILVINKDEGYLRKVIGIQSSGSTTRIITQNARLDEVLTEGSFDSEIPLDPSNLRASEFSSSNIRLQKDNAGFSLLFNHLVVGVEGGSSMVIDGGVTFSSPKVRLIYYRKGGVDSIRASVEIDAATSYVLKTDGAIAVGGNIAPPWGSFSFAPVTIFVGPLPVLITPKIKLVFGVQGAIQSGVDASFQATTHIAAGVVLKNDAISPFVSYTQTAQNPIITTPAKGSITGYILLPKVGLYIYSVAGPIIDLKFYGKLQDKTSTDIGLYFGLAGEGGFETDILKLLKLPEAQWKIKLFSWEKELTVISVSPNQPPSAPSIPLPANNATDVPVSPTLGWVSSDPDGDILSYDLYLGTLHNPPLAWSDLASTSHPAGTLFYGTKYYWRIVAKDSKGASTSSAVWNFTTQSSTLTTGLTGLVKDAISNTGLSNVKIDAYKASSLVSTTYSDVAGAFSVTLTAGSGYRAVFSKSGYLNTEYQNILVPTGSKLVLETVLQIDQAHSGNGAVSGTIRNAITNAGVSGAYLKLRSGINVTSGSIVSSTTTSSTGGYGFSSLNAGHYTVEASATDYSTTYFTVLCIGAQTTSGQDAVVSPTIPSGETRIVLTWGAYPEDLDSHLTGPVSTGSRFHVYWYSKTATGVTLDRDDVDSYGPETITISEQLNGVYRYSVCDFSNLSSTSTTALSTSGAQVRIYRGSGLVATINVPQNREGNLWSVFEIDGSTISTINRMTYVSASAQITKSGSAAEDPALFRHQPPK